MRRSKSPIVTPKGRELLGCLPLSLLALLRIGCTRDRLTSTRVCDTSDGEQFTFRTTYACKTGPRGRWAIHHKTVRLSTANPTRPSPSDTDPQLRSHSRQGGYITQGPMENPLMDEIERLVLDSTPVADTPNAGPSTNNAIVVPPSNTSKRQRLKMLANLVLSGSPFSTPQQQQPPRRSGEPSSPTTPTPAPPGGPSSRRTSLDTYAFSLISPPSSPQASEEINGAVAYGRLDGLSGREVSACGLFHHHHHPAHYHNQYVQQNGGTGKRFWTRIWLGLYSPTSSATSQGVEGKRVSSGRRRYGHRVLEEELVVGRQGEYWWDDVLPLDGEEGELVDDEACFVDASDTVGFGASYCPLTSQQLTK